MYIAPARIDYEQLFRNRTPIPTLGYGRVSSPKQFLDGEGMRRQHEAIFEWIAKHPELNLLVAPMLEEKARSAWKGDHATKDGAALASIVKQVENGELSPPLLLIMESLDRFDREDLTLAAKRLLDLLVAGVAVATVKDDKIYTRDSKLTDMIMSLVYLDAAHQSSEDTSRRVSKTKRIHVEDAIALRAAGITPHVIHQNCPAWCYVEEPISKTNRATRKVILIERHGETVLKIYVLGLHHGSLWITRWLIENNIEPFGRSGRWSIRSVKKILRSKATIGILVSKHGEIKDAYPRIPGLTDDLWLQVQDAQDERKDKGAGEPFKPKSEHTNLLKGIGQCAFCNRPMRLGENPENGYRYYRCRHRAVMGKSACENRFAYRQDIIEDAMLNQYGLGWLEAQPKARKPPVDPKKLEVDLAKLLKRQKELQAALSDPDQDLASIQKGLQDVRSKVSDAGTRMQAARQAQAVATVAPKKISDLSDRTTIAATLKRQLMAVRFGPDNQVLLVTAAGYVLFVTARSGPEQFVGSFLERIPRPEVAQHPDWDWGSYREWHRRSQAPHHIGFVVGHKTRKSWIIEKDYSTAPDSGLEPRRLPPSSKRLPVKIKK